MGHMCFLLPRHQENRRYRFPVPPHQSRHATRGKNEYELFVNKNVFFLFFVTL